VPFTQVFENLKAVAEAAGGSLNHIVKLNVFLTDLGNFAKVNETRVRGMVMVRPAERMRGRASQSTLTVRLDKSVSSMDTPFSKFESTDRTGGWTYYIP
jgi:hypothetical protein